MGNPNDAAIRFHFSRSAAASRAGDRHTRLAPRTPIGNHGCRWPITTAVQSRRWARAMAAWSCQTSDAQPRRPVDHLRRRLRGGGSNQTSAKAGHYAGTTDDIRVATGGAGVATVGHVDGGAGVATGGTALNRRGRCCDGWRRCCNGWGRYRDSGTRAATVGPMSRRAGPALRRVGPVLRRVAPVLRRAVPVLRQAGSALRRVGLA